MTDEQQVALAMQMSLVPVLGQREEEGGGDSSMDVSSPGATESSGSVTETTSNVVNTNSSSAAMQVCVCVCVCSLGCYCCCFVCDFPR